MAEEADEVEVEEKAEQLSKSDAAARKGLSDLTRDDGAKDIDAAAIGKVSEVMMLS